MSFPWSLLFGGGQGDFNSLSLLLYAWQMLSGLFSWVGQIPAFLWGIVGYFYL